MRFAVAAATAVLATAVLATSVLATSVLATGAFAQSAAPVGLWVHTSGRAFLSIAASGYCHYQDPGLEYGGASNWDSGSTCGFLTVMNAAAYGGPQPIYLQIRWVDRGTIAIKGDIFVLRNQSLSRLIAAWPLSKRKNSVNTGR